MIRYVVAGTGHSGTAWAARVLTLAGGRCGHEQVLNHDRPGTLRRLNTTDLWGDSSLAAGAYLADIGTTPVLHLLRDPLAVVNSWVGSGVLTSPDAPVPQFMATQVPDVAAAGDPVAAAIRWVAVWSEMITARVRGPYQWRRVETFGVDEVADVCPYLGFLPQPVGDMRPGADTNRHVRAALTWDDIDRHPDGALLRRHAHTYGYEP